MPTKTVLLAFFLVAACGTSGNAGTPGQGSSPLYCDGTAPAKGVIVSETIEGHCSSGGLPGKAPGEACAAYGDCASICCGCMGGMTAGQVQVCDSNTKTCATPQAACCAFAGSHACM